VGSQQSQTVDIRIIAATHRDLEAEIAAGRFRQDLYWRLHVVTIELPPLRERDDDILMIARHLLHRSVREYQSAVRGFSPDAVAALKRYAWPGNIRQLENRLKRAVLLADKAILGPEDLDLPPTPEPAILTLAHARERFQHQYIHEVLAFYGGNRSKTARALGVDRRTLFRYLVRQQSRTRRSQPPRHGRDDRRRETGPPGPAHAPCRW
jgi:DNA-binding NtrC family response regulator